jgi:Zn-dependent peptidase ImmA (M78 family)
MAAMTVRLGDQWAVLLGKDSGYPAPIAFYVAHELGHVALNHLAVDRLIVDFEEVLPPTQTEDAEEKAADEFALELLTGDPRPMVLPEVPGRRSAIELARRAMGSAAALEIEPGILAQVYGYSTGDWATATAAMRHISGRAVPIWTVVNGVAGNQLDLDGLTEDATDFLEVLLGQLST